MAKTTRRQKVGTQMADALIEWIHMMYQRQTARGVLAALITRLEERKTEFIGGMGLGVSDGEAKP